MARPKGMSCMLCGCEPCACDSQGRKVAPRKTSKPKQEAIESSHGAAPSAAAEAMRTAAARARHERRMAPVETVHLPAVTLSEDEYALLAALRCFKNAFGELVGSDVDPYRMYLDQPASIAERSASWRVQRRWDACG
jgi:hypothetical protein